MYNLGIGGLLKPYQPFDVSISAAMFGYDLNNPNVLPTKTIPQVVPHYQTDNTIWHGTTTLTFKFQGGIMVAADSRATGGMFIGTQKVRKVFAVNDYTLGTMAGGAADCSYWSRVLVKECRLHELRFKERMSLTAASRFLFLAANQSQGVHMGLILSGYDRHGASHIFTVDSGGNFKIDQRICVGSGSRYALGFLEKFHNWNMTNEEAIELAKRAIYHASFRDAYTGGTISLYLITPKGWKHVENIDCMDLHYEFAGEKIKKESAAEEIKKDQEQSPPSTEVTTPTQE